MWPPRREVPIIAFLLPSLALASVCYQVQSKENTAPESLCVTPVSRGGHTLYKISEDPNLSQAEQLHGKATAYYEKNGDQYVKLTDSPLARRTGTESKAPDAYHFALPLGKLGAIDTLKGGAHAELRVLGANSGTYDNRLHAIQILRAITNDNVCADCGMGHSEIGVEKKLIQNSANDIAHALAMAGSLPTKLALPDGVSFIYDSAADPSDSQTIYALGERAHGLKSFLKSMDGGKTWTELSALGPETGTTELYDRITVSAGGKDIFFNSENAGGWGKGAVFHSTDGGKTFSKFDSFDGKPTFVHLSPDGQTLLVSLSRDGDLNKDPSFQSIVRFRKSGAGWARSSTQIPSLSGFVAEKLKTDSRCVNEEDTCPYTHTEISALAFDPRNPSVVYAGTGNHLYRYSSDRGWEILSSGVYNDSMVYNIEIVPKTNEIVMSTCNSVYHASAAPDSENVRFSKYRSPNFVMQGTGTVSTPGYMRAFWVAVNPDDPSQIVATASSGVYLSKNGGKSWQRVQGGELPDKDARGLSYEYRSAAWLPDGSVMVSGVGVGAYSFKP